MSYAIRFAPQVLEQLDAIEQYIARAGSPRTAKRYVEAIVTFCENLLTFPLRGTPRDDLLPGLRTTNHRRSTVIAYTVDENTKTISILGVFYGGQNYEAILART